MLYVQITHRCMYGERGSRSDFLGSWRSSACGTSPDPPVLPSVPSRLILCCSGKLKVCESLGIHVMKGIFLWFNLELLELHIDSINIKLCKDLFFSLSEIHVRNEDFETVWLTRAPVVHLGVPWGITYSVPSGLTWRGSPSQSRDSP